jgi:hypothetical protein
LTLARFNILSLSPERTMFAPTYHFEVGRGHRQSEADFNSSG